MRASSARTLHHVCARHVLTSWIVQHASACWIQEGNTFHRFMQREWYSKEYKARDGRKYAPRSSLFGISPIGGRCYIPIPKPSVTPDIAMAQVAETVAALSGRSRGGTSLNAQRLYGAKVHSSTNIT